MNRIARPLVLGLISLVAYATLIAMGPRTLSAPASNGLGSTLHSDNLADRYPRQVNTLTALTVEQYTLPGNFNSAALAGETMPSAQELLDLVTPTSESGKDPLFHQTLLIINDLAKKLRDERFKNGAINFETVEVKFNL